MPVAIGEKPYFQRLCQLLGLLGGGEHRWHDDQSTRIGGNAVGKIKSWQCAWCQQQRCGPVDQGNGKLAEGDHTQDCDQPHHASRIQRGLRILDQHLREQRHDRRHGRGIGQQRRYTCGAAHRRPQAVTQGQHRHKSTPALVDEVIADMRSDGIGTGGISLRFRHRQHFGGNIGFGYFCTARKILDGMAITVARGEIHRGIGTMRIPAQDLFDGAGVLDEVAPVHHRQEPQ